MTLKKWAFAISYLIVLIAFQNCSESASFNGSDTEAANLNTTGDNADENISDDPGQDDTLTVIQLPPRIDDEVKFDNCESYQEIAPGISQFELPSRIDSGVCFYKKLINEVEPHSSGKADEVRVEDVLASDHDGDSKSYIAPYLLGDSSLEFSNFPGWKMAISGTPDDPKVQMAIDNFYFLQLSYNMNPRVEIISAFGTADAEPGKGAMPILYKNMEINEYKSFAPSGTAHVDALELTPESSVAESYEGSYNLRFRALDCGGSAEGTDVYLVFY